MIVVPPAVVLTIGAIGAAAAVKLVIREWQRVNAELERAKTAPVAEVNRHTLPRLRRDPTTGIYRP
jgi:hypothetical protein